MTPTEICATAKAYGAHLFLDEDGDLSYECDPELPPAVLALLREHREALVAHLSTPPVEPSWNLDDPVVKMALAAFGDGTDDARIVAVVKPGEPVPAEFEGVTDNWPTGEQLTADALHRTWLHIAVQILNRDFGQWPADKSTIASWRIGLGGYDDRLAKLALARLDLVKPVKWGKKDHRAGRLLPRKPANNTEATDA